jgi:GntR family transcriptional regulator, transcriptional repressor for pyruvate dehydrogenase complex
MNELPLRKVLRPRPRVSDSVFDSLVELLSSGTFEPGDKLPNEVVLAKQLGVARSSLREAVRSLVVGGVLEASPGRGTIVAVPISRMVVLAPRLTNATVRDFYELRVFLEAEAAARAAKNWIPQQLVDIEEAYQSVNELMRARKSWFAADARFHSTIAKASKNSALFFFIRSLLGSFQEPRQMMNPLPPAPRDDMEDHAAILAAIKERKPNKARAAMELHLARALVRFDEAKAVVSPRQRPHR